jgi:hypothetical protein
MLVQCFLVSGGGEAWLCSSLNPIERLARFADPNIAKSLRAKLSSRPGSPWAYMESCEIDCDMHDGEVTAIRELRIVRGTAKHQIV